MDNYRTYLIIILIVLVCVLLAILLIPKYRKRKEKSSVTIEFTDIDDEELNDLYISIIPDADTREKAERYGKDFLSDQTFREKNQVYISKEINDRIKRILPLIAPELSCTVFISNILINHLEEYSIIIRVISENNFKKTMKSWNTISNNISS